MCSEETYLFINIRSNLAIATAAWLTLVPVGSRKSIFERSDATDYICSRETIGFIFFVSIGEIEKATYIYTKTCLKSIGFSAGYVL